MVEQPPSKAEFASWLRPGEALDLLPQSWDFDRKRRLIIKRLAEGDIIACAAKGLAWVRGASPQPHQMVLIGAHLWAPPMHTYDNDLWVAGDVSFDDEPPPQMVFIASDLYREPKGATMRVSFKGVRFDPGGFRRAFDLPDEEPPAPASKAGRPPASWWEDLWIEIARQLYAGDLKPDSQVLIERAMQDWISAHDHEAGETTVRRRAQRLFQALIREDRN